MQHAKILIVEDESVTALGIKHKLERLGYTVIGTESSGEGAIKKSMQLSPNLILMDIVLKGDMDGIQAADKINQTLNIPIIYLTAYSDDELLERAKKTHPYGFIIKPFSDAELLDAVQTALKRKSSA